MASKTSRRNFTCVYPDARNVHLVKDIGMIANVLARSHGYESHFVCLDRGREFTYQLGEARWLKVVRLEDQADYRQFRWPPKSVVRFLAKNARRIDVLQLFNHTRETMILGLLYKLMNPRGFLYLKLDANEEWLQGEIQNKRSSKWIAFKEYFLPHLFIKAIPDLLTAESEASLRNFRMLYPWSSNRLELLPNGFDDVWFDQQGLADPDPSLKENLVISVGRIGTDQKNTELLMDALLRCDVRDWKVVLIGTIEESFRPRIEAFFGERPDLRGKIEFVGEIRDRRELYSWYARAKVFCLTSRWEGFALALVDALPFGCHIVSTPVSSIDDVLGNGLHGTIVRDQAELVRELEELFCGRKDPMASFATVLEHSKRFRWSELCSRLAGWIGESV